MSDTDQDILSPELRFLSGGGQATQMILARDWSTHPLGPPVSWPDALKVALGIVLNSPESMILSWGRDDLIFFFNETYFPLLGPRLNWAMGARFDEVWADGLEQARPIIAAAFAGRSRRFTDLPWKLDTDRGQEQTWWTFSYSRVLDKDGNVAGLFIVTNETTDRVLSESRAAAEQDRQRQLLMQMPGFTAVLHGPQHVFHYVNDAYIAIAGRRDFNGRSVREVFPELKGQGFFELLDQVYSTGERYVTQGMPIRLAGEDADRFIDFVYEPIRDQRFAVTGIFVGGYDATETYRALDALRRSEAELRALNAGLEQRVLEQSLARGRTWQLSPELIGVLNSKGYFENSNPAWQTMLGWSEREVATTSFFDFIHPDDQARTQTAWTAAIEHGEPALRFENRYRCKDGTWRWLSWVAVPEADKVYCSARDVTLEKQAEADLVNVQEALRQSQKMEAVGQLTGGIAHDFNNLLQGITGSLEIVQRRVSQGRTRDLDRFIDSAVKAANRAAALTHRLLAFSRRQPLDPRPVRANPLVASMDDLLRRTLGEHIELETVFAAGLWPALCDPNQLENAILNLAINARDAMPRGGKLTIETSNATIDDGSGARPRDLKSGDYVCLCVSDTGIGMTPETIARAFEPFFTTKPIGQGTGLGLSMIYGFARQSEGMATIYSEPGMGTTFKLYLPRHCGDDVFAADTPRTANVPMTRAGEVVLVVEDEPIVRDLIVETLVELGYQTLEAADGPQGVDILLSRRRIDLLITDLGLPGLNGRQVADAGRESRPDLKVLFMTGYAENAARASGFLDPGMQMITKPFAIETLAIRIRAIIEG